MFGIAFETCRCGEGDIFLKARSADDARQSGFAVGERAGFVEDESAAGVFYERRWACAWQERREHGRRVS